MEASKFVHGNCSAFSTRPSIGAHKPSYPKLSDGPLVVYNQCSFQRLNIKIRSAKCYPLSIVAAQEDDKREHPPKRGPSLQRAYSFNSLTIGKQALEKFMNLEQRALARDPSHLVIEFEEHLKSPRCDPEVLQELAWELEMSGKEENAVQLLTKKLSKIERDLPLGEEALNLRRLLVELLIYQGKYYQAKVLCESLMGEGNPSLKCSLYLAVIYELMGDSKNSKLLWEKFQCAYMPSHNLFGHNLPLPWDEEDAKMRDIEVILSGGDEGAPQFDQVRNMSFLDFQNQIEDLREEIDKVKHNQHKNIKAFGTKTMSIEIQLHDDFLHQ